MHLVILVVEDLPGCARFECPEGDATFSVEEKKGAVPRSEVAVCFECADLDTTVSALKKGGVVIESGPQDRP